MKNLFFALLAATSMIAFSSCNKDDEGEHMHTHEEGFEYHAHINSPNSDMKIIGDALAIDIDFESHAGKTIHHISVTLSTKEDGTVIYSKPDDAHIHEMDGAYKFEDTFDLTEANGLAPHTDYVLEAKVWGDEAGKEEVVETVEFHLHMN